VNLPNLLTLFRFVLIPIYLALFFSPLPGRMYWALGIVLLAGVTDVVDGYLARRNGQVTQLGIMLDPLADKCMMLAVFLSLLLSGKIGILVALAIFFREFIMIIASATFHFRGKKTVPANGWGKVTTLLFYLILSLLMFDVRWAESGLWIVIILSYMASFIYFLQFLILNEEK
jgi:cardiolipin synthase (CMP-forming)